MTKLYKVTNSDGMFLMSTTLAVLAKMFRLHPTAVDRIERETADGGKCELFFGISRPIMELESIIVSENTLEVTTLPADKLATPGETKRKPSHVNREAVRKMEGHLQMWEGFHNCPELDGAGGSYTVWQRQTGTPGALEVRLFTNRFFRIINWEGEEVATGVGIIQLRSAMKSQVVR
jgi:hypothetical protein